LTQSKYYMIWAKVNHDWKPEVLLGVSVKASRLLNVALCNPDATYTGFKGTGSTPCRTGCFERRRRREHIPLNLYQSTKLNGVTSKKTIILGHLILNGCFSNIVDAFRNIMA